MCRLTISPAVLAPVRDRRLAQKSSVSKYVAERSQLLAGEPDTELQRAAGQLVHRRICPHTANGCHAV